MPGPGAVEVHLRLGPRCAVGARVGAGARRWHGTTTATVTDVVLDVSGMAWFERLLLQLGPAARVVSPPELDRAGGRRGPPGAGALRGARPDRAARRRVPIASAHERRRFQPRRHRGVPRQPRRGRGRVRRGPGRAADDDGSQVGSEAGEPARRPGRGDGHLYVVASKAGRPPTRTGTTTSWPIPRSRSSSATSTSTPSASPITGARAGPPLRRPGGGSSPASPTTRRRRPG